MKFFEFLKNEAIQPRLTATDKECVIAELLSSLIGTCNFDQQDETFLMGALMQREELGSTAIGEGVAIPHTKHPTLDRLICTMGVSQEGINFDAIDGQPVHIFFLLISPTAKTTDHLRALECITHLVREPKTRKRIQQAADCNELAAIIEEADGVVRRDSVEFAVR